MTKIVKMSSAAVVTGTFSKSLYPDFSCDWYFKILYHNLNLDVQTSVWWNTDTFSAYDKQDRLIYIDIYKKRPDNNSSMYFNIYYIISQTTFRRCNMLPVCVCVCVCVCVWVPRQAYLVGLCSATHYNIWHNTCITPSYVAIWQSSPVSYWTPRTYASDVNSDPPLYRQSSLHCSLIDYLRSTHYGRP